MIPEAYVEYLVHFHADRDYFECHEILEEYWKEHPGDPLGGTWVCLIQIAVSLYHQRRGNRAGARKMIEASLRNMDETHLARLGIDAAAFRAVVEQRMELLTGSASLPPYADLNIPISDDKLLKQCVRVCERKGLQWGRPSDPSDPYMTNKHTLRDRSEVVEARAEQLERRRETRGGK
ncbi:MAG: hypothetical protein K0Q59_1635 [Paenibacillus sp.]|jgi:predicted metal-dependent hydrolase|nr:hypothetical protein [Paenibacillus sp.]